jgi:regulator of sirC expression with transglutaminase-like and TPR domain
VRAVSAGDTALYRLRMPDQHLLRIYCAKYMCAVLANHQGDVATYKQRATSWTWSAGIVTQNLLRHGLQRLACRVAIQWMSSKFSNVYHDQSGTI